MNFLILPFWAILGDGVKNLKTMKCDKNVVFGLNFHFNYHFAPNYAIVRHKAEEYALDRNSPIDRNSPTPYVYKIYNVK